MTTEYKATMDKWSKGITIALTVLFLVFISIQLISHAPEDGPIIKNGTVEYI